MAGARGGLALALALRGPDSDASCEAVVQAEGETLWVVEEEVLSVALLEPAVEATMLLVPPPTALPDTLAEVAPDAEAQSVATERVARPEALPVPAAIEGETVGAGDCVAAPLRVGAKEAAAGDVEAEPEPAAPSEALAAAEAAALGVSWGVTKTQPSVTLLHTAPAAQLGVAVRAVQLAPGATGGHHEPPAAPQAMACPGSAMAPLLLA